METVVAVPSGKRVHKVLRSIAFFSLWVALVVLGVGIGMRVAKDLGPALTNFQSWQLAGQGMLPAMTVLLFFAVLEWWRYQRWPISLLVSMLSVIAALLAECGVIIDIPHDAGALFGLAMIALPILIYADFASACEIAREQAKEKRRVMCLLFWLRGALFSVALPAGIAYWVVAHVPVK